MESVTAFYHELCEINIRNEALWETMEARQIFNMPPTPQMILVVDDSPQMALNLEIALTSGPEFAVRVVPCGREALAVLEQADCGVVAVVTDLEMPRMDGYELIAALRNNPRWALTPIIVSSGTTDPEAPERAKRLGANAYFTKPYSPMKLRMTLTQLLAGAPI
jgi:CheY-like chemotaxis protein